MATLAEPAADSDMDIRVEDYLEDKLQSPSDLNALDELIANVELQRNQLQSQLDDAVKDLEDARRTTEDRHGTIETRIGEFQELQDSIDVRVRIAAESDAPSEAIARLQEPMKKLQTVELAQRYLVLLQDAERLQAEARSHLPGSPKAALEPYAQLKELAMKMRNAPGSNELHLVEHVESAAQSLWNEMKQTMNAELEAVLVARQWPRVSPDSEMDQEWLGCIEKLIDLQMPEIIHSEQIIPLLPLEVMSKIFVAEFRFHFLSDKPTSAPQAIGTHCFPWFLSVIEKWEDFFKDNLSHLLAAKFKDTTRTNQMVYVDPVCALVTSMLPIMRTKIGVVLRDALQNPSFLSSFMSQLMTFDDNIRSRFGYDGGNPDLPWTGLTAEVLATHFEAWFQVEKQSALDAFAAILSSQDARKIDYDFGAAGKMKPTYAAVRVTDLLRTVTTKYERLHRLKHKLRFLTQVQLDVLDGYHDRLRGSLEVYQSMTSTLGRTLHGATKEQLAAIEGVGALETLCKVIGSADHIANTLNEWSDDEFFTIMWDDLQSRETKDQPDDEAVTPQPRKTTESAIFDETVTAYTTRRKAAEDLLVGALANEHAKAFRSYTQKVQWTTIGDAAVLDDPSQLSITPELDQPLAVLKRNFEFLHNALSTACFRRVWREALTKLQDLLWSAILLRQSFTTLGAAQFAHDGAAIFNVIERYLPGGSAALNELQQGMRLLSLPAEVEGEGLSLKNASDRAFKDNEEARKVLEELHLDGLTPLNARNILQRRVENNENIGW